MRTAAANSTKRSSATYSTAWASACVVCTWKMVMIGGGLLTVQYYSQPSFDERCRLAPLFLCALLSFIR
jgi:hypothetical protein